MFSVQPRGGDALRALASITNIPGGGEFDTSSLTPHDSNGSALEKLEGFWVYEGIDYDPGSGLEEKDGSVAVTEKTITLNEKKIECLPKSIDFRPYSPIKALISQGFGYGAAVFQDASETNDLGILEFQTATSMPYGGNGFVCTTSGSTLALGFLGAEAKLDSYGAITNKDYSALTDSKEDGVINECSLTEVDYEISLDGDRLTLSCDGVSATYLQQESTLDTALLHRSIWLGEPLYEGDSLLDILGRSSRDLSGKGYEINCNLDDFLPACSVTDELTIETPGGSTLSAKLVNPYEKSVPFGFAIVCWYEYDKDKAGKLTIGRPSDYDWSHSSQEFGVTPYADVYNNYELPYEASQDSLCYKAGYGYRIQSVVFPGDGYDTGDTVLETEHSCEIRLEFNDNVLSSITVGDAVYLNAGLQDNIARDDLDELEPSVYREATVKRDEILDELKKAFAQAGIDAAVNEKTGEVVMDNSVLFATDSYELGDAGKEYLDRVFAAYASVILDEKYSAALKEVSFEGNTDSDGESEYNMRLSENRANAVMSYCSGVLDDGQRSVFDGLAVCRGYGESDLVYDENGYENKDASRRVAIKFFLEVN